MKRFYACCLALCLIGGVAGCEKEDKVEKETTVTSPGGQTTTRQTIEVEKSGENPPAAQP